MRIVLNAALEGSLLANDICHIVIQCQSAGSTSGLVPNRRLGRCDANGHGAHQSPAAVQGVLGALVLGKLYKGDAGGAVVVKQQAALCDMPCT